MNAIITTDCNVVDTIRKDGMFQVTQSSGKTLEFHTRRGRRRGLVTISIHCWGLVRYELFSVWAHLSLFKLKRESHTSIKKSVHQYRTCSQQINDSRIIKTLTCALRAAACWIWLLLSALLKGSLSSRVFLCTISRGFLNMASSSLTPAPQVKNKALLSQTHIISDLARASGDNHGEPTHPLDNTSRRSSPCTPRSPVLLSHIQVPPSLVLAEQGSARAAKKKPHTRHSVYLTMTGSFGLASKRPDKLYTYILKNHQAS